MSSGSTGWSQIRASAGNRRDSEALEAMANRRLARGWRASRRMSSIPVYPVTPATPTRTSEYLFIRPFSYTADGLLVQAFYLPLLTYEIDCV